MPDITNPLRLQTFIEFGANRAPDVAPAGKSRLWWDSTNNVFKLSVNGGAYAEIPSLLTDSLGNADLIQAVPDGAFQADAATRALFASGIWLNAQLGTPKVVVYQETVAFGAFTDGGGASGTYALQTTIPAGARFLNSLVSGITGFAGDTSAVLIIGDGTDTDRYNTGTPSVFVTAAAGVDLGAPSGTAWHAAAKTPTLTITSGSDWGLVTAGALTVTLFYLAP